MSDAITKVRAIMGDVADNIKDQLFEVAGEPVGFALVVFVGTQASYVSNVQRDEVVLHMRQVFDAWDAEAPQEVRRHEPDMH